MAIERKPKCIDGPRQQLTTGTEVRECLLKANPIVLIQIALPTPTTHDRQGDSGNAYCQQTQVSDGPPQQLKRQGDSGNAYCQRTQVC